MMKYYIINKVNDLYLFNGSIDIRHNFTVYYALNFAS